MRKPRKSFVYKDIRGCSYAGGGNRTHTALLPTDFESASSTSSDTPAGIAAVNAEKIVTYMGAKCKRTAFYSPNIFRYSGEKSSVAK